MTKRMQKLNARQLLHQPSILTSAPSSKLGVYFLAHHCAKAILLLVGWGLSASLKLLGVDSETSFGNTKKSLSELKKELKDAAQATKEVGRDIKNAKPLKPKRLKHKKPN